MAAYRGGESSKAKSSGGTKIWIENDDGEFILHYEEPFRKKNGQWVSEGGYGGESLHWHQPTFKRLIPKGMVAEFHFKTLWE